MIPNGESNKATEQGTIPLSPLLSTSAKEATILPELKSSSLISLGQLADDGCTILLTKRYLTAIKYKRIVLKGHRNIYDGLWDIPIQKTILHQNNFRMPNSHSAIYAVRKNDDNEKCCITSHKKIISALPIHNMPFKNLENMIGQQLKIDRLHSPIALHLRDLDGLYYDNIKANKQSSRSGKIYKKIRVQLLSESAKRIRI